MGESVKIYGHRVELPDIEGLVTNVMVIFRIKNPENMKEGRIEWASDEISDAVDETGMVYSVSAVLDQGWYDREDEDGEI